MLFPPRAGRFGRVRRRVLTALIFATLAASCVNDIGLIDRVQPGALHKSVFEGEWYFQRTVVDVPFTVGWSGIGEAEETERVKWVIEQDKLVAYRTYDFIDGTDVANKKAAKPGEKVTGQPVAVYPILKHLDVTRDYSPATGEQTNVLLENDSDRPWYDRAYIRVDWAHNQAKNFNFVVDSVAMQPAEHVILNPSDPDSFTVGFRDASAKNGTGWRDTRDPVKHREAKSADYIDFVTKVHASPEVIEDWDPWWGPASWPLCWFYFNEECKAAEIKVRTSLLKVELKDDYIPLHYPDNYVLRDADGKPVRVVEVNDAADLDALVPKGIARLNSKDLTDTKKAGSDLDDPTVVRVPMFDKFGYFRTERFGYDEKQGEVESARPYYIARHDIWQQHKDAAGQPLAYDKRTPKPIVYYLGQGFDPVLAEAAQEVGKEWDDVFREVVAARQGKAVADVPPMFVIAPNTLSFDGDGEVNDRGQRVGDIRYSLFNLVNEPTRAGWLGYGPTAMDPTTGKILSGHAHSYAGPLKVFAANGRDILRLARGDIDPIDFGLGYLSEEDVKKRLARFVPSDTAANSGKKTAGGKAGTGKTSRSKADGQQQFATLVKTAKAFADKYASRKKVTAVSKLKPKLKVPMGWGQKRAERIKGTALEDRLVHRDMALLFGSAQDKQSLANSPGPVALSPAQKARISPVNWSPQASRILHRKRHRMLAKRTIYHQAFAHDAVLGLAEQLKDVADPDAVWKAIYVDVFKSTALHEIGHTLGLRHNFEASTDALNYHSDYWKLRGDTGKALDHHTHTDAQLKGGMLDHRYSSIMEYSSRFHHDIQGLGRYDKAAIAFGYGQLVQVWGDTAKKNLDANKWFGATRNEIRFRLGALGTQAGKDVVTTDPDAGEARSVLNFLFRGLLHYTEILGVVGGVGGLDDRKWVPYSEVVAQMSGEGSTGLADPKPRTHYEVPFRFCSDEYDMGTATCAMYDEGADPFEIVNGALDKWHDYYFVRAFRRDRTNFFTWDYEAHVYWTNFLPALNQYQYWVDDLWDSVVLSPRSMWDWLSCYRGAELGIATDANCVSGLPSWQGSAKGGLANSAGVQRGLNTLAAVISTPEPGSYCFNTDTKRYEWLSHDTNLPQCKKVETCFDDGSGTQETGCADLVVPLGEGRYDVTEYDEASGYYYYERLRHIGAFYDKWSAISVLTTPETMFIGVDASQALNNYVISTMLYFRPEIMRFFGALIAGREDQFGWKVGTDRAVVKPNLFASKADREAYEALPPIEVPGQYNMRPTAMWMGMAWFNADWDQTFNHSSKVWVEGNGEGIDPPANATVISFDNPHDFRTYKAVKLGDENLYSIGYELVKTCKAYADTIIAAKEKAKNATGAAKEDAEIEAFNAGLELEWAVQYLELLRGYQSLYGVLIW